jgi:hypothetical protein
MRVQEAPPCRACMHQAGRVMCCFGRAVRTRLVFFFLPCTGGPRGHGGNGNACRPSLAACCVGHHAHRVHDDVKPASRLFVWWSTCNIADYDYLFDALLISWKWC